MQRFCPYCGQDPRVPSGDIPAFCIHCGHDLRQAQLYIQQVLHNSIPPINPNQMQSTFSNSVQFPQKNKSFILPALLVGALSMYFAEVFAGSSNVWFINAWSILVTFPLYLSHLLLFLNLAIRTKRTSVLQLYFFGCIFALYESWITKVLWVGYSGEGAGWGTILGVGILEYSTLVFFWHPVFAFVLPVLVYELFCMNSGSLVNLQDRIIPSHLAFMQKNKSNLYGIYWLMFIGATFSSFNNGYNIILFTAALGGSLIVIWGLNKWATQNKMEISIENITLSSKGFRLITVYVILFNVFWLIVLLPQRLPSNPIYYLPIIGSYILFGFILKKSNPIDEDNIKQQNENILKSHPNMPSIIINPTPIYHMSPNTSNQNINWFGIKDFWHFNGYIILLGLIYCFFSGIGFIITIIVFVGIPIIVPFFFLKNLLKVFKPIMPLTLSNI